MKLEARALWAMPVVMLVVAVAALVLWLRADDGTPATPDATPSATAATNACPVDEAICEFAVEVERVYREGDLRDLLSPKSTFYPETGVLRAAHLALGGPLEPRVVAIGCAIDTAAPQCADAFSLVLTSYPPTEQVARERRVILGFERDGSDLPIINANILAGGIDIIATGGETGRCDMSGRGPNSDCLGTRFYPWASSPEILRAPTPAPAPTTTTDPLAGVEVVELKPGMQSSIGYDTIVYYSNGCYGCGRPKIPGLFRAYRDASGQLRNDDLFGPLFARVGGYPQSVAADWERGHILVLVCATGYCGGEGEASSDATVRVFRSRDGGVTFAEEPATGIPLLSFLSGFVGDEAIVRTTEQRGIQFHSRAFLYPSMTELVVPPGIGKAEPFPDGNGEIAWLTYDPSNGLYDSAGNLLVPNAPGRTLVSVTPLPAGRLVHWAATTGGGETFGQYDGTGKLIRVLHTGLLSDFRGQVPNGLLVANVTLAAPFGFGVDGGGAECKNAAASYASLVNSNTGTVHPIIELGDCEGANQHRYVNAIVARTVVRVNTGTDCLNVRSEPATTAAAIGCFADGVLLPVRGDGPPPVVPGWLAVVTPGLEPGWVAEEFVAR